MLETAERTSLRELARAELQGLYALARDLCGAQADDLVQQTLLRACRSFAGLQDLQAGPKWLRVIMVNIWRDNLRKDGREPDEVPLDPESFSLYQTLVDEDPFPYSDTMHIDFLGAFSHEDVHEVLARMPERFRVPLVLRYLEGFPAGEVAELLDQPAGTVYSNLHRGRQHFERSLWEYARESGLLESAKGRNRDEGRRS